MSEEHTVSKEPGTLKDSDAEERVKLAQKREQDHTIFTEAPAHEERGRITREHDGDATSYSNYLFGAAGSADRPLWSDTFKGRATIRFFSRFVVGSLLMTAVDRSMRGKLFDYDPKQFIWNEGNFYTKVSYIFDKTFGRGIQKTVKLLGGTDKQVENSVRFRNKMYYRSEVGHEVGRSLGAEMTAVTASFAAGSFGDAATRNIIQVFDPNAMKVWMVNDKGQAAKPGEKKHFDFDKWMGSTVRTTWRVLSKNMGEDWAVALPYVYQMRWQRNLLAGGFSGLGKRTINGVERNVGSFPDVKVVLDPHMSGGSMHLDKSGRLLGNFEIPGAIDFQMRFVGYNWYTLMYRETYDAIGRQLGKWADSGFSLKPHLPKDPIGSTLHTLGYGARYVAKSFIKANLYMQPAVPFFWIPRVAASRVRSAPVMNDQFPRENAIASQITHGQLLDEQHMKWGNAHLSRADLDKKMFRDATDGGFQHCYPTTKHMFSQDPGLHNRMGYRQSDTMYFGSSLQVPVKGDLAKIMNKPGGMYSAEYIKQLWAVNKPHAIFSAVLTPIGWLNYKTGSVLTKVANHLPEATAISQFLSKVPAGSHMPGMVAREGFLREYSGNAFAYTPYMIAKAETALRVDERPADGGLGEMDKAIYKFIDSSVRFDMKNTGGALKDIWHHATNMNRAVKMREGGEADTVTAKSVLAPEDRPTTKVHTSSVQRQEPAPLERADEVQDEKSWAESVTGRELAGSFQHSPQSIH